MGPLRNLITFTEVTGLEDIISRDSKWLFGPYGIKLPTS